MNTVWEMQILDCWRIHLKLDPYLEIIPHFEKLAAQKKLPSFESLLKESDSLIARYASQGAYQQALFKIANEVAPDESKFPIAAAEDSIRMDVDEHEQTKKQAGHTEDEGFDGDRVLANSILFKFEYSMLMELAYSVSEGDIGRVFEVMKVLIFMFAGSNNNNYRDILVNLWCLFRYESSPELKDAIWNNWLVNLSGEAGSWIPADLMQEHYNRWLEDHVGKSGMSFDDPYLRNSISPNLDFFLSLKKEFEVAFDLHKRSQSHTSPHRRDEFQALLQHYEIHSIHSFHHGHSCGHAAVDLVNAGFSKLDGGVLRDHLEKHSIRVSIIQRLEELRRVATNGLTSEEPITASSSLTPSSTSPPADVQEQSDTSGDIPICDLRDTYEISNTDSDETSSSNSRDADIPSTSSDSDTGASNDEDSDNSDSETEHLAALLDDHSQLPLGPETMPVIDLTTGELIQDWMNEKELEDTDVNQSDGEDEEEVEESSTDAGSESESDEDDL